MANIFTNQTIFIDYKLHPRDTNKQETLNQNMENIFNNSFSTLIAYVGVVFVYLVVIPLLLFYWMNNRWNVMGKFERLGIYGLVFLFFPGLISRKVTDNKFLNLYTTYSEPQGFFMTLLSKKYSSSKIKKYLSLNEGISAKASKHNKQCLRGNYNIIYKFNENVIQGEEDVVMEKSKVNLKGFKQSINLKK